MDHGGEVYRNAAFAAMEPDPVLTVSEWADAERMLSSRSSNEPGRWRTARTPYLREPMDALSATSRVRSVVFMKGAQIGATEMGNNWIGYSIAHDPCPMLAILPTVELAKRGSRQRLDPMIADSPALARKVSDKRSRDSGNTVLSKEFPGGILVLTGANSAVGLRSMPARKVFADELDAWPGDVDGEGDPELIAERAIRTAGGRAKILKVSTPTIAGRSRIEVAYDASDRRRFHVPCPECGGLQVLVWRNVRWDQGDPSSVVYACEHCGAAIEEFKKTEMLEAGEWIPEVPELSDVARGYHLSSLYSPVGWFSWKEAAAMFQAAAKNQDKLRVFVNTVLGETFAEKGEAPPWEQLYNRREEWRSGEVPSDRAVFLTMGVDVQHDYLQGEVVAWGREFETWSVDAPIFSGDTATDGPWDELERYLQRTFPREDGVELQILRAAIDSGDQTQEVYRRVRGMRRPDLVMAIKGDEGKPQLLSIPRAVDVTYAGRKVARGLQLWRVGTDLAKGQLYGWLRQEQPTDPDEDGWPTGWAHFPNDREQEWFQQLTAEQLVPRIVRGYRRYVWEKTRDRNEALDCRVYARAAAASIGIDRMTDDDWDQLESNLPAAGAPKPETPKRGRSSRERGTGKRLGYLDRRRRQRGR